MISPASSQLIYEFGISKEVSILATALYVLGFAIGPLLFGPASEVLGRKYPLSIGVFFFAIFSIPIAVAKNVTTIFVCRFLYGTFAAAPLAIIPLHPHLPSIPTGYTDPETIGRRRSRRSLGTPLAEVIERW